MNKFDTDYLNLLRHIYCTGYDTEDRTSVGMSRQLFGQTMSHTYEYTGNGFYTLPFVQSRIFGPKLSFEEWKWMMSGSTDVTELQKKNIHIWDGNSTRQFLDSRGMFDVEEYNIGKAYGYQFRKLEGNDQIQTLISNLKHNPKSRRHLVTVWNPTHLNEMALEPCAHTYNFTVINDKLNLMMHMRSTDVLYGLPYNWSFGMYFLLSMCKITGLEPGQQMLTMTNAHIYENQFEIVDDMIHNPINIDSDPKGCLKKDIKTLDDMLDLEYSDFQINDFIKGPKIGNAKMAV